MRLCNRNLKNFFYALFDSKVPIVDANGHNTGRYELKYQNPEEMTAYISAARGVSDTEQFGVSLDYERTIITDDMDCPINETSILWIDVVPEIDGEGKTATPNDYKVVKVAKSINYISYAIKKVR